MTDGGSGPIEYANPRASRWGPLALVSFVLVCLVYAPVLCLLVVMALNLAFTGHFSFHVQTLRVPLALVLLMPLSAIGAFVTGGLAFDQLRLDKEKKYCGKWMAWTGLIGGGLLLSAGFYLFG